MNVKTVNYWYFVFAAKPRHDPDVFQSCYVNEDIGSNLFKRLSNIPNAKYRYGIFYTSCKNLQAHHLNLDILLAVLPSETRIKGITRILYNSIHFVSKLKMHLCEKYVLWISSQLMP